MKVYEKMKLKVDCDESKGHLNFKKELCESTVRINECKDINWMKQKLKFLCC